MEGDRVTSQTRAPRRARPISASSTRPSRRGVGDAPRSRVVGPFVTVAVCSWPPIANWGAAASMALRRGTSRPHAQRHQQAPPPPPRNSRGAGLTDCQTPNSRNDAFMPTHTFRTQTKNNAT
eukprot:3637039-Pyramimonas_sp.AAC.1